VKRVGQLGPDTVKGYVELSSAGSKKNLLGPKVRELISIAVAVAINAGAALVYSTRVLDAVRNYPSAPPSGT
jgi:hypothetical protein